MAEESIGKPVRLPSTHEINKANELREKLQGWMRKDKVLGELKQIHPGCGDFQITLCKVLAINDFYFARCSDTINVTDRIIELKVIEKFSQINQNNDEAARRQALVDLVNDIAKHQGQLTDGVPPRKKRARKKGQSEHN